jgi:hypothetical protein
MSIRTTVTLDEDVFARLKQASVTKGVSFKEMLNEAIRSGLTSMSLRTVPTTYTIKPESLGKPAVKNLDNIGEVIATLEGESWR